MIPSPRIALLLGLFLGATLAHAASPVPFANGGFEDGLQSWVASKGDQTLGLSQTNPASAHTGKAGLRVTQKNTDPGSWLQSARLSVDSAQTYQLTFWTRMLQPSGIGVWVQFYDENHQVIKPANGDVAFQLTPSAPSWIQNQFSLTTPPGAAFITLAIHGYSNHVVQIDFDDFSLTPASGAPTASAPAAPISYTAAPVPANAPRTPSALTPDPARVQEIAACLPAKPKGIGPSIDDRAAWASLAADTEFSSVIMTHATRFLTQPIPPVTPEAFNASVQSGDRKIEDNISSRRFRLTNFVLAEGMEDKGRFIKAIEAEITAICAEPTWTLSAHVKFTFGRNDLGSAMTSWNLATADSMLGDHLSPAIRQTIRDRVNERALSIYLAEARGQTKPEWWSTNPNNWNAVVHGGIVGSALALLDSVQDRALIVAAAELGTRCYIKGFPADGYSSEGMGYWKYGFGHYTLLAEAVLSATGGKINFYDRDNSALVAQFPRRFEIIPGVYPAYGDAQFLEPPSLWLYHILDCRYGFNDHSPHVLATDPTFSAFLYAYGADLAFDSSAPPVVSSQTPVLHGHRMRDWFEQSQVYVGRPATADSHALAVSLKGGNNGTSHGHNDLATFVAVYGGQPILVDPGVPVYNATTMGPKAYEFQIKASYGHSVPLVAGQPQQRGAQYATTVKARSFTDALDSITLDLTHAYAVPALGELTRRFDYNRAESSLTITDHAAFSSPQTFGTALVTYGEARQESHDVWLITYKGQSLRVKITVSGDQPFTVTDEMLRDESRFGKVRRLGINLDAPSADATITLGILPAVSAKN